MQLRTSIAKRVSKFNLDGMDEERDNRHGMPGKGRKRDEGKMGIYVKKV